LKLFKADFFASASKNKHLLLKKLTKCAKHVLCVDDDPETLKVRKLLLEDGGYTAVTVTSGQDALHLLAHGTVVDLVLLDYLMPGMNGDELAEKLRRQYPQLPLVVVSAVGQLPSSLLKLTKASVQKGRDPQVLLSTIASVLAPAGSGSQQQEARRFSEEKTVLCVEDERVQLKLRKLLLESAGFHVLEAVSAPSAMELFRASHVDAVVMDYWLSGQNGTALAEEMKGIRPRIPIVMLSGFASLPGEEAIVDSWLRKAEVEPEDLIHELTRLIALRRESRPAKPR
jgi:CheY-like chemotaxis protein